MIHTNEKAASAQRKSLNLETHLLSVSANGLLLDLQHTTIKKHTHIISVVTQDTPLMKPNIVFIIGSVTEGKKATSDTITDFNHC